ncbi:MAG: hypothetical protein M0R47_16715 [Methylobacter sp.]|uniref:hypothetical protein n=1 Tax=Methylobacter sp. TaxID=2051955 RepID=UPI0025EEB433|nr:hypothetical protein [Methylobacter sp.]MCK9622165.1 hypothetical protein [Methylobacter sp.]
MLSREEIVEEWGKGNFAGWFDFAQYIAEMAYNRAIEDAIKIADPHKSSFAARFIADEIRALKDKEQKK